MMPSVDVIPVEMYETFVVQLIVIIGGDGMSLGFHFVVDMVPYYQVFLARDMIFFCALAVKCNGGIDIMIISSQRLSLLVVIETSPCALRRKGPVLCGGMKDAVVMCATPIERRAVLSIVARTTIVNISIAKQLPVAPAITKVSLCQFLPNSLCFYSPCQCATQSFDKLLFGLNLDDRTDGRTIFCTRHCDDLDTLDIVTL